MRTNSATRPPRVPFGRPLSVTPEGVEEPIHLQAVNLSRGGMFVQADQVLPEGTHVFLALAAAGRMLDFAEGEVVWVRTRGAGETGFAVRFTRLRPRAQALVEHLVARGGTGGPLPAPKPRRGRRLALATSIVIAVAGASFFGLRSWSTEKIVEPVATHVEPLPVVPMSKPIDTTAQVFPGEFQIAMPTGGATALRVNINDQEVVITPSLRRGAAIRRVFNLTHPSRLVIDIGGREPKYSWQLEGTTVVKSVRIGARNHGTRVVIDIPESPDVKPRSYRVVPPATGGGV